MDAAVSLSEREKKTREPKVAAMRREPIPAPVRVQHPRTRLPNFRTWVRFPSPAPENKGLRPLPYFPFFPNLPKTVLFSRETSVLAFRGKFSKPCAASNFTRILRRSDLRSSSRSEGREASDVGFEIRYLPHCTGGRRFKSTLCADRCFSRTTVLKTTLWIDAKREDHFLQSDFPLLIPSQDRLLPDGRPLPANPLSHTLKTAGEKRYFLSVGFSLRQEELFFLFRSWEVNAGGAEPDAPGFLLFHFPFRRTRSKPIRRALRRIHVATIHGLC